jgi:hypothetical protein
MFYSLDFNCVTMSQTGQKRSLKEAELDQPLGEWLENFYQEFKKSKMDAHTATEGLAAELLEYITTHKNVTPKDEKKPSSSDTKYCFPMNFNQPPKKAQNSATAPPKKSKPVFTFDSDDERVEKITGFHDCSKALAMIIIISVSTAITFCVPLGANTWMEQLNFGMGILSFTCAVFAWGYMYKDLTKFTEDVIYYTMINIKKFVVAVLGLCIMALILLLYLKVVPFLPEKQHDDNMFHTLFAIVYFGTTVTVGMFTFTYMRVY